MSTESGYKYDNGLSWTAGTGMHGRDRLAYVLDTLKRRRRIKKPTIIVLDGMSGEGKTTMAVHIADYIQGEPIDIPNQVYMGGEKFIAGLQVCYQNNYIVVVYTEAGDFGKQVTLSRLSRTLDYVFETFRTFNVIVIIDLPFMPKLDAGIFQKGIPRMLVHCYGRTMKQGNFSVYELDRMDWLRYNAGMPKVVNKQKIYSMVQPNFRGHFKDLTPDRSMELDAYCTSGKKTIIEISQIKSRGLLGYSELAAALERSREWTVRNVRKAGFKPALTYKGKVYFEVDVLHSLKARRKLRGRGRK